MGREHGGGLSLVDDAMFVRVRAVHLGVGRHPLEGQPITHLRFHEVSTVRQAVLAQTLPRPTTDFGTARDLTLRLT